MTLTRYLPGTARTLPGNMAGSYRRLRKTNTTNIKLGRVGQCIQMETHQNPQSLDPQSLYFI